MAVSTAVGSDRVSRVVGYKLLKGQFQESTPNLPQRIAILGEANTANQTGLTTTAVEVTSQEQAGTLFGFGSPIHQMMRILRPTNGDGVGGIPTIVFPQLEPGGGTPATSATTVTGTANGNATHTLIVNGRSQIEGQSYSFSVVNGDDPTAIATKMADAMNAVLSSPAIGSFVLGVFTATAKWASETSTELTISVDTGGNDVGVMYATAPTVSGTGVTDISDALTQLGGNEWNTILLNPYNTDQFAAIEAFNGRPDPDSPTGRYAGIVFKPLMSIWGSKLDTVAALQAITDVAARKPEVTHVLAPAPNSAGYTWEASANVGRLFAVQSQNAPHKEIAGQFYPDMPVPADSDIGEFSDYNNRDTLAKSGSSTVDLVSGRYQVQDLLTTYHPDGESPPQFRDARDLMVDFNVRFGVLIREAENVLDKTIVASDQAVRVPDTIKPKQWKAILSDYAQDLALRALITDPQFMIDSIQVSTDGTNPDRFNTEFRYKRTGTTKVSSSDVTVGFAFGTV